MLPVIQPDPQTMNRNDFFVPEQDKSMGNPENQNHLTSLPEGSKFFNQYQTPTDLAVLARCFPFLVAEVLDGLNPGIGDVAVLVETSHSLSISTTNLSRIKRWAFQ